MKILCSYSGIEFNCEHFPGGLFAREAFHPIFHMPQRKLITFLPKWAGNQLTDTDSYLLFLALLQSSERIEFRTSARATFKTKSIVAQNMELLVKTLSKLNTVSNPSVVFPSYVISHETCDLANVQYWLQNWEDEYQGFITNARKHSAHDLSKINRRVATIERLIKSPHKTPQQIAPALAEWAASAGDFPTFTLENPVTHQQVPCDDYWKYIIIKCADNVNLFSIPRKDIKELLEHCEENISYGTIQSFHLFKILRKALERQKNWLDLGDLDLGTGPKYTLLDSGSTAQDANMKALVDSAPESEPKQEMYKTKFEYMRAKMRWDMAKKLGGAK